MVSWSNTSNEHEDAVLLAVGAVLTDLKLVSFRIRDERRRAWVFDGRVGAPNTPVARLGQPLSMVSMRKSEPLYFKSGR
jgi:hypothetical protein